MGEEGSQSGFNQWIQTIAGIFTAVTGFVAGVVGFVQLWQGDFGLVTIILLVLGVGALLLACIYYAWFWRPERNDTGIKLERPSNFAPQEDHDEYAAACRQFEAEQTRKDSLRKRIRQLAVAGLVAIPLIGTTGFTGWQYWQNRPSDDVVILVAEFDGPDAESYRVTDTILANLRDATDAYPDVVVDTMDASITEREGSNVARAIAEQNQANILIWGWYGKTDNSVGVSANFEILDAPQELPKFGNEASGQVRAFSLDEFNSFELQTELSSEMAYLTLFTLGMAELSNQNWQQAIGRFSDALAQTSEPVAALDQSIVYFFRGKAHYYYQQDYEQEIADYTQAIALNPNYTQAYSNRGLAYAEQGDYELAFADLNQAIALDPKFAFAYNNRGLAFLKQGEAEADQANSNQAAAAYERALADLNQAIELDPTFTAAYNNRGLVELNQGDYEQAIADFNRVLALKPDDAVVYRNRGRVYSAMGEYQTAIADFDKALELKPDYAAASFERGVNYYYLGQYDAAIADFKQTLALQPDNAQAYFYRGLAYDIQGQQKTAIADYDQAITLDPENAYAYNSRGYLQAELGEYDAALTDLNRAIELKPDDAYIYDSRGFAHLQKGDFEAAIADLTQAIRLNPNLADAYLHRGRAYSSQGKRELAIQDLQAVGKLTDQEELRQEAEQELSRLDADSL